MKLASMLARELLTGAMALPDFLLPRKLALLIYAVSRALLTICFSQIT